MIFATSVFRRVSKWTVQPTAVRPSALSAVARNRAMERAVILSAKSVKQD